MDVKQAVRIALSYIEDLFSEPEISNLALEEVVYDSQANEWDVTVGFSRPWDYPTNNLAASLGIESRGPERTYKVVTIDNTNQRVTSVKNRVSRT